MIEVFEVGSKFKSSFDTVCEIIAVVPGLDSDGMQCYVVKTFYEIGKFIFDIAEHDSLLECEQF